MKKVFSLFLMAAAGTSMAQQTVIFNKGYAQAARGVGGWVAQKYNLAQGDKVNVSF